MKIRYVGPHEEVTIAATGDVVKRNHQVEVTAELGRELVKQADWEKVTEKTKDDKE